ncbi:MAG: 16S rRNA (uracil(1498)-N(3))-methyltransferase [Actinobacteria bacterium]|nr:16S rRNA (uracil(1498)-N(3))-methyltransferase [Actinomycetota bacterium]
MSERRFFTFPELVDENNGYLRLPDDEIHHALNVLRLRKGSKIVVIDGSTVYHGRIEKASKKDFLVSIEKSSPVIKKEPKIVLWQAFVKGKKASFVVEKATEAGVDEIVFFPAERSIANYESAKLEKLKKVAIQASKQSKRDYAPSIRFEESFYNLFLDDNRIGLVLDFDGEELSIKNLMQEKPVKEVNIFIGPEGGFTENERKVFVNKGLRSIRLDLPVLRTETAALAAVLLASVIFRSR